MDENVALLITNIVINFFDFMIFITFCNNLIEKKMKIKVKVIFWGVLYGIVFGTLGIIISNGNTVRTILTVTLIIISKWISKRKIHDVIIIYGIIFLCTSFIQTLSLLIISSFKLKTNGDFIALLAQTLTIIIFLYISVKIPLHKLLDKIEKELLLKLLTYTLLGIFLLAFFYFEFNYTPQHILYFSILILLTFIGLYRTLKRIFFYTNKVPMQLHDVKNILMGMSISAHHTSDISVIRNEIDSALQIIDMNMNMNMKHINTDDYNQNILILIEQKKNKTKQKISFLTDISYFEPNAKVTFTVLLYMLGVLLDNAIESGTKKAIIIKVSIIEESLFISVANEYKKKSTTDFNKMFQERYSTKGESSSRGYGLPNLSRIVTNYGGEILLKEEYLEEHESNYLIIAIHI